jgi:hypothetical protein
LGRNGSGNYYFWLKTDRLKTYLRSKEAQTGLKLDKSSSKRNQNRKNGWVKYCFGQNGSIKQMFLPAETKAMGNSFSTSIQVCFETLLKPNLLKPYLNEASIKSMKNKHAKVNNGK